MNLLVTLNENYFQPFQVMMTSIHTNMPEAAISLYIFYRGWSAQMLEKVQRWCEKIGYTFHPYEMRESLFAKAPVTSQYPIEMYYRLLAWHILPKSLDKVLYLDPDILVINPLDALWSMPLKSYLFAAASHTGKTDLMDNLNRVRLGVKHPYFNTGVLLMNLEQERKKMDIDQINEYIEVHRKELILPDQDVFNALYGDYTLPLDDQIWNYDARNYNNYWMHSSGSHDLVWVMKHTSILHFCGKMKPWKQPYFYRFGILYYHYQQLSKRAWTIV